MELMTITEVTKAYNVSTRQLRYYDQIGLLKSTRKEDYAYRVYDECAVRRLQQILILRKLRIPLKQIASIFNDPCKHQALEIFQSHINELSNEISALQTIKDILVQLAHQLDTNPKEIPITNCLIEEHLISILDTFHPLKPNFKEAVSMKDLNNVNEVLRQLKDVRIVMLPPFTVVSYQAIGDSPEEEAGDIMYKFIKETNVYTLKPDARMFGFNHPDPKPGETTHGYEVWVTIPDDLEIAAPFVKKKFEGGLYAVHTIDFPNFQEWELLAHWANNNDKYVPNYNTQGSEIMHGCLEEHLNWVYMSHMDWPENGIDGKLDLYLPIKYKA